MPENIRKALERLEALIFQRQNNAVVALDLGDVGALDLVCKALREELREIHR